MRLRTLSLLIGVLDGFQQGQLRMGRAWSNDQDANECYDHGGDVGEALREVVAALYDLAHALLRR